MATPNEGLPLWGTDNIIETVDGKTFASKVEPPTEVKNSGLKYQEPMARSWFNYQFNLIRKWIEELDSRTSGGAGSTVELGWISYSDTQYTSGSPLVISQGTTAILANNAGSVINVAAPDGQGFYDGSKITPDNSGDAYTLSCRLNASSSVNEGALEILIDIGDGVTPNVIIGDTRRLVRGSNNPEPLCFDFTFFSLDTFVANGGTVQLRADTGNISVHGVSFMLQRTYRKDNS